jgi:hypothetical protein
LHGTRESAVVERVTADGIYLTTGTEHAYRADVGSGRWLFHTRIQRVPHFSSCVVPAGASVHPTLLWDTSTLSTSADPATQASPATPAEHGSFGGVLAMRCGESLEVQGVLSAAATGFAGAVSSGAGRSGHAPGSHMSLPGTFARGFAPGGGWTDYLAVNNAYEPLPAGSGGHATHGLGHKGHFLRGWMGPEGGAAYGDALARLDRLTMGAGGGSGESSGGATGHGGRGGGVIFVTARVVSVGPAGRFDISGGNGTDVDHVSTTTAHPGGAGAAGALLLEAGHLVGIDAVGSEAACHGVLGGTPRDDPQQQQHCGGFVLARGGFTGASQFTPRMLAGGSGYVRVRCDALNGVPCDTALLNSTTIQHFQASFVPDTPTTAAGCNNGTAVCNNTSTNTSTNTTTDTAPTTAAASGPYPTKDEIAAIRARALVFAQAPGDGEWPATSDRAADTAGYLIAAAPVAHPLTPVDGCPLSLRNDRDDRGCGCHVPQPFRGAYPMNATRSSGNGTSCVALCTIMDPRTGVNVTVPHGTWRADTAAYAADPFASEAPPPGSLVENCAVCDVARSTRTWSPAPGSCMDDDGICRPRGHALCKARAACPLAEGDDPENMARVLANPPYTFPSASSCCEEGSPGCSLSVGDPAGDARRYGSGIDGPITFSSYASRYGSTMSVSNTRIYSSLAQGATTFPITASSSLRPVLRPGSAVAFIIDSTSSLSFAGYFHIVTVLRIVDDPTANGATSTVHFDPPMPVSYFTSGIFSAYHHFSLSDAVLDNPVRVTLS